MKEMKKSEDIYNSVKGEIDKKKKKKLDLLQLFWT